MAAQRGAPEFDAQCRLCPRLAGHLDAVRAEHPDYHAAPVPPFGDSSAQLLIVGLAPGLHGANATGRPFTGDHAGILLYQTLFATGFANQATATRPDDGLELIGCRITNAVKCLPPGNKPTTAEVRTCNRYLVREIQAVAPAVIVALGRVAHDAVIRAQELKLSAWPFAHGRWHELPAGPALLDSYHCSRYNTQTGRLTADMLHTIFRQARSRCR